MDDDHDPARRVGAVQSGDVEGVKREDMKT
jgi:hypothetical protein